MVHAQSQILIPQNSSPAYIFFTPRQIQDEIQGGQILNKLQDEQIQNVIQTDDKI